jgi:hypothetical protein
VRNILILITLFLAVFSFAQDNQPKPVGNKDPMTAEQIAIYRTVLINYIGKENDAALNIASRTRPFTLSDFQDNKSCLRGTGIQIDPMKANIVHQLPPAIALSPRMVLVDPDQQNKTVKQNDPQNLIHRAIDDHQPVTEKELETSVNQAFANGLFTFSEIVFNKQHTRAVLKYSFHCGMLCGHGNTVLLKKVNGKWKFGRLCGGWIS